ncbi:efflux RND transporter periplasmic adaptor subunit [Rurimicrobium arvi]|uniref:Efflux RND transporter periplasmic adaptor subunit n=1 Tax=Rurimicrobium arvi TaxID=2049916 RepID=A0ABP8MQ48_9BACT
MSPNKIHSSRNLLFWTLLLGLSAIQYGCGHAAATENQANQAIPLPVITVSNTSRTVYQEYPAALEGRVNVEIRPQVSGYLTQIYVDEGAYVQKGQQLFRIDDRMYNEQLQQSHAALNAAKANVQKAQVELDRLTPLVESKVISPIQLKTAKEEYAAAKAMEAQAQAGVSNARINLGYTLITAPVSGYIGRIPYKLGSLVAQGAQLPLTVLSDVKEMYAYFSLSEKAFMAFQNKYPGKTIEEKISNLPPVELVLADNSVYAQKGKMSMVEGQFDKTVGAIALRAAFPNEAGTLRTGNTGRIRVAEAMSDVLIVPQESTFEIQDKVFVFTLDNANKAISKPISVSGKTAHYYYVSKGLTAGEKIVYSGIGNLHDGTLIAPQRFPLDSLLKAREL